MKLRRTKKLCHFWATRYLVEEFNETCQNYSLCERELLE